MNAEYINGEKIWGRMTSEQQDAIEVLINGDFNCDDIHDVMYQQDVENSN